MSWQTKYLQYIRGINNYYQGYGQRWTRIDRKNGMDLSYKKRKQSMTPIIVGDIAAARNQSNEELIDELKRDRIISEEV